MDTKKTLPFRNLFRYLSLQTEAAGIQPLEIERGVKTLVRMKNSRFLNEWTVGQF